MVFSSAYFLLLFLPLVLLIYFIVPKKFKNLILLAASIYFYTYGEKFLVLVMIFSSLVDFKCGLLIESGKKKLGLRLSLLTNLITLGFFKYFNFGIDNLKNTLSFFHINSDFLDGAPTILLPMGISFYVFQTMSYSIDVYRGNVKANRNLLDFMTYVTMFPQLVAGPIIRYIDLDKQLKNRKVNIYSFSKGLQRFVLGLSKKMILANTFAGLADTVFSNPTDLISTPVAWAGIIAYSLQIYFDFSGYSDMAIGLGRMFGFTFPENFNYPYISKSIKEFWRRWHISLSTWFRDYLYIPLGGNKKGKRRTYINLFIVFFVTGLWHGASWNFIIWGLFHGLFLIIERIGFDKILNKLWKPAQHIYTLLIVLFGWVFFRAVDLNYALDYCSLMINYSAGSETINQQVLFFYNSNIMLFITFLGLLFSTPIFPYLEKKLKNDKLLILKYAFILLLLYINLTFVASDSYNPFIYFRF